MADARHNPKKKKSTLSSDKACLCCDRLVFGSLLVLAALYPLVVNPFFPPIFTMFKLLVLRLITLVMVSAWLVKTVKKGRFTFVSHPLNLAVSAFFAIAVLSTAFSINPLVALFGEYARWEGLLTLLNYVLIYFIALNWELEPGRLRYLTYGLVAGALVVSALGLAEHFVVNPVLTQATTSCGAGYGALAAGSATHRSFSTFGNAAFLGGYLALVLPITLSLLFLGGQTRGSWVFLILVNAVAVGCWLFTLARAAWIGVSAGVFFIFLANWDKIKPRRLLLIGTFVAIVAIIFSLLVIPTRTRISPAELVRRTASIFDFSPRSGGGARLEMWKHTLPIMADHPLLGTGPDTFKIAFTKYKPSYWTTSYKHPQLDKPHNELFQLGSTLGIFGAISFVWIILSYLWFSWQQLPRLVKSEFKPLVIGLMAGALSYFINLQFVFSHLSVSPLFWLFLGLSLAVMRSPGKGFEERSIEFQAHKQVKGLAIIVIIIIALVLAIGSVRLWQADVSFNQASSFQMRRDWPTILGAYEKAASLNPLSPDYQFYLGKAYGEAALAATDKTAFDGYFGRSLRAFKKAESLNPLDENIFFIKGKTYLGAGRVFEDSDYFRQAILTFRAGLGLNPSSSDAWLDLGVAYGYLGQFSQAVNAWEKAISIDGGNADAYYNLGWAYHNLNDFEKAKAFYRKALKLHADCRIKDCPVCVDAKKGLKAIEELDGNG